MSLIRISWETYLTVWFGAISVYYGYILFRYYPELLRKQPAVTSDDKADSIVAKAQHKTVTDHNQKELKETSKADDLPRSMENMKDELKAMLQQSAINKSTKEEILKSSSLLMKKYEVLKDSDFRSAITNMVAAEVNINCRINLSTEEVEAIWN